MTGFVKSLFIILGLLFLMGGCLKLGPDYQGAELDFTFPEKYQHAPAGTVESVSKRLNHWWSDFGDPELDRLVLEALSNNLEIEKTVFRIMELEAGFVQARADRLPSAGLQGQAKKSGQTVTTFTPPYWTPASGLVPPVEVSQRVETDSFSLSLPVSFELDLWGRLARTEEAAWSDLLQARENRLTVAHTVAAETAALYLEVESYERRLATLTESIEKFRLYATLLEKRYDRGLATVLSLRQARRLLAQAEAGLPALRQNLGLVQQKLAVLTGSYPTTTPARSQPEDYYRQLPPVPPGLPSELLCRRPDVRAAEAALMAANARIGAAKASRFPSISLTGGYGFASDELDRLLLPESELWNIALGLVQPVFNAGKLLAAQKAAEARHGQVRAEYARTVLNALAEVEAALLKRKELIERREKLWNFLKEARATEEVAESRYARGLTDYLNVLDAQQTRFTAEDNLIQADLAIWTNRVDFYRALGGGWNEGAPDRPDSQQYAVREDVGYGQDR